MARIAFTGSFDPPHVGHIYIVDQARRMGFEVVVIVANNADKTYQSSLEDRLLMARMAFKNAYEVVSSASENIGTVMKQKGCGFIVRGVRNGDDFEYEQMIADWNRKNNGLETFYIPAPPAIRGVSSTKIKSAGLHKADE